MNNYRLTTLPNGLRVASIPLEGMSTVALAISVDVGSRYEEPEENGLSHFLEHMAFKGTASRSALDIAEAFDDMGASMNAYTSSEQTVYYARALPQDLPQIVEIFADILQRSTFAEEELERERGVILQEIAMHQDTPEDLVMDYFHEAMYGDQPLGRSILGTITHVSSFTSDDLRCYMQKHYVPARMVVSAAGVVDHEALVELVKQHFVYNETGEPHAAELAIYRGGDKRVTADFEQMHLMLGFPGVSVADKDYYAAQVMATALGGGMSSRLFQEVREKRGLAYSVYAFLSSQIDSGIFGVYAAAGEISAAELAPVLCEEIKRLAEQGISEAELQRAKRQHLAGLQMMRESVSTIAEWMGKHLLVYGEFRGPDVLAANYEKVTREDVQRVLRRLLAAGELTSVALGPQKGLPDYIALSSQFKSYHEAA